MLIDVVAVKALPNFNLFLTFKNGVEGVVDFGAISEFEGLFKPLSDPAYFAQVTVNKELGFIFWPNEADCSSEVLYWHVTGVKDWEDEEGVERAGRLLKDPNGEVEKMLLEREEYV